MKRCDVSSLYDLALQHIAYSYLPSFEYFAVTFLLGPCGRRRFSSQRLQHPLFLDALQAPLQKIDFSACWPILRSNSAIRPSDQRCFPLPGNTLPGPCRNSRRQRCSTLAFTSNARATSPMETPCSSRRTAASLNSL